MYNGQDIVQSVYMKEVSASKIKKVFLSLENETCHKTVYFASRKKVIDIIAGPIAKIVN